MRQDTSAIVVKHDGYFELMAQPTYKQLPDLKGHQISVSLKHSDRVCHRQDVGVWRAYRIGCREAQLIKDTAPVWEMMLSQQIDSLCISHEPFYHHSQSLKASSPSPRPKNLVSRSLAPCLPKDDDRRESIYPSFCYKPTIWASITSSPMTDKVGEEVPDKRMPASCSQVIGRPSGATQLHSLIALS